MSQPEATPTAPEEPAAPAAPEPAGSAHRGADPIAPRLGAVETLAILAVVGVALTGASSLVLANAGWHSAPVALAAASVVVLALVALGWRAGWRLRLDLAELGLLALAAVLVAVLYLPGFPYLVGDKDPGVYAAHAVAIERTGGTVIADPVLERADQVPVVNVLDDRPLPARFPGLWVDPDRDAEVRPQFFHLLPSLLATASWVGGYTALFNLIPALAGLSLLLLGLAVRRSIGSPAALLAIALLGANLLQVWHSRHPSTEVLAQLFVAGAGLCLVAAVRERARALSAVAGALVAMALLARPDGLLVVVLALAVGGLLVGLGRGGPHPVWFLAGLAVALPYPLLQAYVLNRTYMLANDLPDWPLVAAGTVAVALAAAVLRRWAAPWLEHRLPPRDDGRSRDAGVARPRVDDARSESEAHGPASAPTADADGLDGLRRGAAWVLGTVTALALLVGWLRPDLFDTVIATTIDGRTVARLDEWNLRKLALYVTVPGLVAMWAGFVLLVRRRTWWPLWLVVLPGVVLLPLYVWEAHIESRMLWWGRRFVPVILPAVAVLMAAAVAAAWEHPGRHRRWLRPLAALAAIGLVAVPLSQSLDIRDHREYGGSVELIDQVAAVAGDEPAVFLWERPREGDPFDPSRVLGGPVWFVHGQVSTLLPSEPSTEDLDSFADAFPDRRLFVVARGGDVPTVLGGTGAEPALVVSTELAHWREHDFDRPTEAGLIPFAFTVWTVP